MKTGIIKTTLLIQTGFVMLSIGCASSQPTPMKVTQYGEMRAVMREGQTQARVSLGDALSVPHAVAVGALEGLSGEITIVDGHAWVSRVDDGEISVSSSELTTHEQACLLTVAHVERWHTVRVDDAVSGAALELLIEQTASGEGIDTDEPFPFMIEGELREIDLHVINGYCPIATDPASVDVQPWKRAITQQADAVLVGFFAKDKAGVMTHHGSSIHAHVVLRVNGQTLSGHIDRVEIEPGMILSVPARW